MLSNERQRKFYDFLRSCERSRRHFSMEDVLKATGWKQSTFKSYLAKGQLSHFLSRVSSTNFEATNTLNFTFKEFEKRLSQSKHIQSLGHNCRSKLAKALLRKSRDNMLLAIELYNRPSLENKLDGFVMLFCTAWEQFLKARLIELEGEESIFKQSSKGLKQTISLRDACERLYQPSSLVRQNILRITELRDNAVHLLIPELQGIASRVFQSGVFNFSAAFEDFCEIPFIKTTNLGMLSLVGDFHTPPLSMMRTIYGPAATDILDLAQDLTESIEESNDPVFAIPLDVTLQFATKGSEGAQIFLSKADEGMSGLRKALTIVKSVDVEKTHQYRFRELLDALNTRLEQRCSRDKLNEILVSRSNGKPALNQNCLHSIIHKLKWRKSNNEFHHYVEKLSTHLYSEKAIEQIFEKLLNNQGYLSKCKHDYSHRK